MPPPQCSSLRRAPNRQDGCKTLVVVRAGTLQGDMIEITPLREADRSAWQPLAVGYNTFYERVLPDADYDRTWRRR